MGLIPEEVQKRHPPPTPKSRTMSLSRSFQDFGTFKGRGRPSPSIFCRNRPTKPFKRKVLTRFCVCPVAGLATDSLAAFPYCTCGADTHRLGCLGGHEKMRKKLTTKAPHSWSLCLECQRMFFKVRSVSTTFLKFVRTAYHVDSWPHGYLHATFCQAFETIV